MKAIMPLRITTFILILLIFCGCSRAVDGTWKAPLVYRVDVQQGNVIDQEMINKLQPGMDKKQVKFIMGTPLITDPFHSNRWDYVYSMEPGKGERQQRRITLFFNGDKLAYIDGDIKINANPIIEADTNKDRLIEVPLKKHKEGFFSRILPKEESEATEQTPETGTESETAMVEDPVKDTVTDSGDSPVKEDPPDTTKIQETTAYSISSDLRRTDVDENTVRPEQKKNLFRRFWDRMTSGADDSAIKEGEESERDRRDAEILESAGGEL
jgi:outer membrane protein assembly factor BamE